MYPAVCASLLCIAFTKLYQFIKRTRTFAGIPGFTPLLSPTSLVGAAIPYSRWNPGIIWSWKERTTAYFNYSHDITSMVPILVGQPFYYTCSVDVMKQLLGNETKTHLMKPQEHTLASLIGDSVASANGETWRRHRRIVSPAFNAATYELVRMETASIYREMSQAEEWDVNREVIIPSVNKLVFKFSLLVIARCCFGLQIAWSEDGGLDDSLTLGKSIDVVSQTLIPRHFLANWMYRLPIKSLRHIDQGWNSFSGFILDTIRNRRQEMIDEDKSNKGYVLDRLIASCETPGKYSLAEREVMANMFTMMFAGHETTAGGITAAMGYLAIHQDQQDIAYSEIKASVSNTGDLHINDTHQLPHVQACFQEATRLFAAPLMLSRDIPEYVPVKITHPVEKVIILPKGSQIIMDLIGIQRNPHTYPDPGVFRPSRWYGVSEPDLPMFGLGPRACLGRKFAHTEAVSFLAHILRDWKLDIIPQEGESRYEYEQRVMGDAAHYGTAFVVKPFSLKMIRRSEIE